LVRVCVVGGGTAGSEAAKEAAARGADVTIVEQSEGPDPPWRSWLDLVESSRGGRISHHSGPQGRDPTVKTLRAEARVVGPSFLVTSEGIRRPFDSVIIATGASFQAPAFIGSRKQGVFVLDSPRAYADLGVSAASSEEVAVVGEGFRALQVADRLSRGRSRVHLVVSE